MRLNITKNKEGNIDLKSLFLDKELKKHMEKTSVYTEILCNLLKIPKKEIKLIKRGAFLHDIGKKFIDRSILEKAENLTSKEFEKIKKHTILGGIILEDENKIIKNIALYHHEKWNGSGYPKGLKGKNIPFEARVVSIVDCYDALRSKRVYKEEKTHNEVIEILKEESGKSFDPDILNVFLKFEDKFK